MNIYDISEKAGVSIATVSRVINGNKRVSEETREKVLRVMKETGYEPNAFARSLGLDTMHTIGILCADVSDNYLANAVYYLEQELRTYGYDVLLCCTGYEWGDIEKYAKLLMSKRVDAVILVGSHFMGKGKAKSSYIADIAKSTPVIMVNGFVDCKNVYGVMCDDKEAEYRVAKAFLSCGKARLLHLVRSLSPSGQNKIEGVKQAFSEKGLAFNKEDVIVFDGSVHETKNMLLETLCEREGYDVIMAGDDELAVGALKYAAAAGLSVPEEIQIIGYNNSKLSVCCEPELTTVDKKLEYLCINAVAVLMRVLKGGDAPGKTTFSADIVIRQTTKVDFD